MEREEILKELKENSSKEINIILEYYADIREFISNVNLQRDKVGQDYLQAQKEEKTALADKMITLTSNLFIALKLADMFTEIALKWGFNLKELFEEAE